MAPTLNAGPHITALFIENVKRLKVVRITPDGRVVQITGANGSGKSSVLDSIYYALAGQKAIDATVPIRKGEDHAVIELSIGPVTVTRKFTESGSTLKITSKDGAQYLSPQRLLDEIIGTLTFDPLEFDRMDAKKRLETLRRIVPVAVDLEELDGLNRADYEARTELGRKLKAVQGNRAALGPTEPEGERGNIPALMEQLNESNAENARRAEAAKEPMRLQEEVDRLLRTAAHLREDAAQMIEKAIDAERSAAQWREKIAALPPVPPMVDVPALVAQVEAARRANDIWNRNTAREAEEVKAKVLENDISAITLRMAAREAEKANAIAAAPMPVPGLSFGDGDVVFNGLPYDQASSAERLRISMAIAMAGNPKLRVIRIKDGSLLDEKSLALVAEEAERRDYQVWMERVGTHGEVGIVMEDGEVKSNG